MNAFPVNAITGKEKGRASPAFSIPNKRGQGEKYPDPFFQKVMQMV
jgi:hypothetical protein